MLPTRARSFLAAALDVDNTRAGARTRTRHMIVISITRGAAPLAANLSFATGAYSVRGGWREGARTRCSPAARVKFRERFRIADGFTIRDTKVASKIRNFLPRRRANFNAPACRRRFPIITRDKALPHPPLARASHWLAHAIAATFFSPLFRHPARTAHEGARASQLWSAVMATRARGRFYDKQAGKCHLRLSEPSCLA